MGIIELAIVGLIVGALARFVIPGRQPLGVLGTLAIGVAGSLLGWWLGGKIAPAEVAAHPWLFAIGGAVLLVLAFTTLMSRGSFRRGLRL